MRWHKWATGLLGTAALTLGGCGTFGNIGGDPVTYGPYRTGGTYQPPRLYGGVSDDVTYVAEALFDIGNGAPGGLLGTALGVVDLPLSAIADTLTVPVVLWQQSQPPQPSPPPQPPILGNGPARIGGPALPGPAGGAPTRLPGQ
jgi:uncharacterized protein YceK